MWRTRKHVGLDVSLRGVLQPSFRWDHTECTGQVPDAWDGPQLYKKEEEKRWVLWRFQREFKSSFASLLFEEPRLLPPLNSTTSSEHIVPACVCVSVPPSLKVQPVSPSRAAAKFTSWLLSKNLSSRTYSACQVEHTSQMSSFCYIHFCYSSGLFLNFERHKPFE